MACVKTIGAQAPRLARGAEEHSEERTMQAGEEPSGAADQVEFEAAPRADQQARSASSPGTPAVHARQVDRRQVAPGAGVRPRSSVQRYFVRVTRREKRVRRIGQWRREGGSFAGARRGRLTGERWVGIATVMAKYCGACRAAARVEGPSSSVWGKWEAMRMSAEERKALRRELAESWAEEIRQELLGRVENGVAALRELPAAGWLPVTLVMFPAAKRKTGLIGMRPA